MKSGPLNALLSEVWLVISHPATPVGSSADATLDAIGSNRRRKRFSPGFHVRFSWTITIEISLMM